MSQSLEQIREQFDSQLDLTLRLLKVSGLYAEKIMETHFLMLHGVYRRQRFRNVPLSSTRGNR